MSFIITERANITDGPQPNIMDKHCVICGMPLKGRQKKFCSIACKNRSHQSYEAQKARGLRRKLEFVDRLGSKCSRCGYAKNLAALEFHHKDDKNFKLDMRSLSNRTYERCLSELSSCVLLCANCHREIHNPDLDLPLDI